MLTTVHKTAFNLRGSGEAKYIDEVVIGKKYHTGVSGYDVGVELYGKSLTVGQKGSGSESTPFIGLTTDIIDGSYYGFLAKLRGASNSGILELFGLYSSPYVPSIGIFLTGQSGGINYIKQGKLIINSQSSLKSDTKFDVYGNTYLNGYLYVEGIFTAKSTVNVYGTLNAYGNVKVDGHLTVPDFTGQHGSFFDPSTEFNYLLNNVFGTETDTGLQLTYPTMPAVFKRLRDTNMVSILNQLINIGTKSIDSDHWGYLEGMQAVGEDDSPTFKDLTVTGTLTYGTADITTDKLVVGDGGTDITLIKQKSITLTPGGSISGTLTIDWTRINNLVVLYFNPFSYVGGSGNSDITGLFTDASYGIGYDADTCPLLWIPAIRLESVLSKPSHILINYNSGSNKIYLNIYKLNSDHLEQIISGSGTFNSCSISFKVTP